MQQIADALAQVKQQIAQAEQKHGRNADSVRLLAVSKKHPAEAVRAAYEAGQRDFGENYLQEALKKQAQCKDLPLTWHFIGPIQSNKTKAIAENFSWVHTVDRLKVAQRLSNQRPAELPPLNVCIQVNIDNEESKAGVNAGEALELAQAIQQLPNIRLRGLMAIPKASSDSERQRQSFNALQQCLREIQAQLDNSDLATLSMGMSNDLQSAIAEGSTIVRIGTAIFGAR